MPDIYCRTLIRRSEGKDAFLVRVGILLTSEDMLYKTQCFTEYTGSGMSSPTIRIHKKPSCIWNSFKETLKYPPQLIKTKSLDLLDLQWRCWVTITHSTIIPLFWRYRICTQCDLMLDSQWHSWASVTLLHLSLLFSHLPLLFPFSSHIRSESQSLWRACLPC